MSKQKTNGDRTAFPAKVNSMGYQDGLSKREMLAAMMMQGLLSNPNTKVMSLAAQAAALAADELLKSLESVNG